MDLEPLSVIGTACHRLPGNASDGPARCPRGGYLARVKAMSLQTGNDVGYNPDADGTSLIK